MSKLYIAINKDEYGLLIDIRPQKTILAAQEASKTLAGVFYGVAELNLVELNNE